MSDAVLSPERARRERARLGEEEFDVLVVGGGIVGAGSALDAATRGLSVAIIEAQDWAAGTSSRSSKLIHGGLRYLQMHDFALVREALRERSVLVRIAPHLVHPLPILFPLRRRVVERAYVGAGVALYDLLARASPSGRAAARSFPLHRQLSRRQVLQHVPAIRRDRLVGAIRFFDAQVDDARYVLAVLRTAASHGAVAASRTEAVELLREGERVVGVRARSTEDGTRFAIRARTVISATGVWSGRFAGLLDGAETVTVQPSKGVHIVVPRARLASDSALILPTEKSVLFVLPWGEHWIIGTTDTPWRHELARPAANAADIDYLLTTLNAVLREPLGRDDIEAVYVGLRPLLATGGAETTTLSREHAVVHPVAGLVIVSGGKYTTYRVMAADAVDAAIVDLGRPVAPSRTATIPIIGSAMSRPQLPSTVRLEEAEIARLVGRYGTLVQELLAPVESMPALAEQIGGYLAAEIAYAVTHEDARHLDDVLVRRTRLALETADRAASAAPAVAEVMAPLLGWDDARREAEVEAYRAEVSAALAAEAMSDDAGAAAALGQVAPLLASPMG